LKAALYAATLGAAGGVFFLAYGRSLLTPADRLAIARPLRMLVAVAIVASAARMLLTAASMAEDAAGMLDARLLAMVWHGGEGRAAAMRALGLLLAIPALAIPAPVTPAPPAAPSPPATPAAPAAATSTVPAAAPARASRGSRAAVANAIAIVGAAGAATSFACVGHGHAAAQAATPFLVGVHVLAVAFWLGALGPLLILARRREPCVLGAVAARFGRIAIIGVGALLAAGVVVLGMLLGSLSELWTSAYGRIACAKIALVACLLALAAWNKLRLVPRIVAEDPLAVRNLRRSIRLEMLVAALILLTTAALTTLAGPPRLS
jgi:putative copper resistance protein D